MEDPYHLGRFLDAQHPRYAEAISELRGGRKIGHWMWFIFPQVAGLGPSPMSVKFAISTLAEAQAYLQHPVLGARLIECAHILTRIKGKSAAEIFGSTDAMKLRSSMTLFTTAAPDEPVFKEVLTKYFQGSLDKNTIARL